LSLRDDITGILDFDGTISPEDIHTSNITFKSNISSTPQIIDNYSIMFIKDDNINVLYDDGSIVTLGSKIGNNLIAGLSTSDQILDVSGMSNVDTVTDALKARPKLSTLSANEGSSLIGINILNSESRGNDVGSYLNSLTTDVDLNTTNVGTLTLTVNELDNLNRTANETLTGNWVFENTLSTSTLFVNALATFTNSITGTSATLKLRSDSSGFMDVDSRLNAPELETPLLYINEITYTPTPSPDNGILFIDGNSSGDVKVIYGDGSSITLGSKLGDGLTVTSDQVKDTSLNGNDGTVTQALNIRPTLDYLNTPIGSIQTGINIEEYNYMGDNVHTYIESLTQNLEAAFELNNQWFNVITVLETNIINFNEPQLTPNGIETRLYDRILLIGQSDKTQNGIYYTSDAGLIRVKDADESAQFIIGKTVYSANVSPSGNSYFSFFHDENLGTFELGTNIIEFLESGKSSISEEVTEALAFTTFVNKETTEATYTNPFNMTVFLVEPEDVSTHYIIVNHDNIEEIFTAAGIYSIDENNEWTTSSDRNVFLGVQTGKYIAYDEYSKSWVIGELSNHVSLGKSNGYDNYGEKQVLFNDGILPASFGNCSINQRFDSIPLDNLTTCEPHIRINTNDNKIIVSFAGHSKSGLIIT